MPNPQGAGKLDRAATTEHALTIMRQLNDTIDVLASIDAETALLTRKCVIKAIDQLLPLEERPAALLHISIENLGRVRNSVGDAVSHEMLRRMVSVTFNNLPGNTIKGRLGDHAIGAVVRLGPHDSIENTARKLRRALIRTQQYGDNDIVADIRIGIALWPQDGSSGDDLVRQAATAAVHHDVGADNITFFNRTASETLARNFELESGLRAAIKGEQMVLHYQPVVDHRAQRAVGAEALVRWNHPTLGVVGPDQFIPIAEQSGLIVELGHWVLREACMQLRSWQDQNVSISHMSVNLSARQFLDPMLEETVTDVLSETGIDPNALQLEITESVAMANIEQTLAVAHRLREMGITMAIDDFGTGHCSMSYLRSLPVDVLKIDRTFVADVDWDLGKGAICEAIITLARGLRLSVVAEGVETRAELDWLAGQGCEVFQGYFFNAAE
jgi:EAL domain-containing protein (putative c-di-GMP-specific phosphodiesterase class I)/GGDEF domain-containing protein